MKTLESRQWSRLEQRVQELRRDADARRGPRPLLRGTSVPGDAWDDYLRAVELVKGSPDIQAASAYAFRTPKEDRSKATAAAAKLAPAVALMRQGAHRAECRRSRIAIHEEPYVFTGDTPLGETLAVSTSALCEARLLMENDRIHEATELLLDALQLAWDLGNDGSLQSYYFGLVAFSNTAKSFKEVLCTGKAGPDDLREIADALETFDDGFPRCTTALLGELEMFGDILVHEMFFDRYLEPGVPLPTEARPGWRHLFSTRLQTKVGFDLIEQWIAQTRDADLGPYSEENRRWEEVYKENRIRTNIVASAFLGARADARYGRQRRCILRLLRAATHYIATGDFPDLEDPFGGKLRHAETEISARIWGVGNNGVDDGGKGDWPNTARDDIVIEIPRRP